jgi:hypothetical protein
MQLNCLATHGEPRRGSLAPNRPIDQRAVYLAYLAAFLTDEKLRIVKIVGARAANVCVKAVHTVH